MPSPDQPYLVITGSGPGRVLIVDRSFLAVSAIYRRCLRGHDAVETATIFPYVTQAQRNLVGNTDLLIIEEDAQATPDGFPDLSVTLSFLAQVISAGQAHRIIVVTLEYDSLVDPDTRMLRGSGTLTLRRSEVSRRLPRLVRELTSR